MNPMSKLLLGTSTERLYDYIFLSLIIMVVLITNSWFLVLICYICIGLQRNFRMNGDCAK